MRSLVCSKVQSLNCYLTPGPECDQGDPHLRSTECESCRSGCSGCLGVPTTPCLGLPAVALGLHTSNLELCEGFKEGFFLPGGPATAAVPPGGDTLPLLGGAGRRRKGAWRLW